MTDHIRIDGWTVPFPSGQGFRLVGTARDRAGAVYAVWEVNDAPEASPS